MNGTKIRPKLLHLPKLNRQRWVQHHEARNLSDWEGRLQYFNFKHEQNQIIRRTQEEVIRDIEGLVSLQCADHSTMKGGLESDVTCHG